MKAHGLAIWTSAAFVVASMGCSTRSGPPLTYLALEKPQGVISTTSHTRVDQNFSRGGWYFGNYNFRPVPDIETYLRETHEHANAEILRDADIVVSVPFAFDLLFFGYNSATDTVEAFLPEEEDE